jgi:hypothetical protein
MDMSRTLISTLICLLVISFCLEARAEVSARTDRRGNYVTTQVVPVGAIGERDVWSVRGRGYRLNKALNPTGDANGDLWPTIAESPSDPHHPLVIWSRFNGVNYDLAWSRWSDGAWRQVEWLNDEMTPGDDLDADVVFDSGGMPYVAWWNEGESQARVYLSLRIAEYWLPALLLSDPEVDSRHPTIEVEDVGLVKVLYETPEGTVTQFVALGSPDTITDDINPQSCIHISIPSALQSIRKN